MRNFVTAFRTHLVAYGISDDDETIWAILRWFMILNFDFESGSPQAMDYALTLARQDLAPEDVIYAEKLWSHLMKVVIETRKAGGSIAGLEFIVTLPALGFYLVGHRNFSPARGKLAEMSRHAHKEIGTTVGGVNLPSLRALTYFENAGDVLSRAPENSA